MVRRQLNINVNPELMQSLKEASIRSGKTITEFVAYSISYQLENNCSEDFQSRIDLIEERLTSLENNQLSQLNPSAQKIAPFTIKEAENCNYFFKEIFKLETKRKQYKSSKDAWNDLIAYIECFDQWNDFYTLRLKEVLFIPDGDLLTHREMNLLTHGKVCPCPIRTGIINWINNAEIGECRCQDDSFPSQQQICEQGVYLMEELYALA